jgi:hypothetical protein
MELNAFFRDPLRKKRGSEPGCELWVRKVRCWGAFSPQPAVFCLLFVCTNIFFYGLFLICGGNAARVPRAPHMA